MAIFKSQIITQASGSVGGLTYSRNKGGMYMRARAVPTNPNTPLQQAVRGYVSQLTSLWVNTLTETLRAAWATYAANVQLTNRLGELINIPPLSMYIRSNVARLQAGAARQDAAPVIFDLGDYTNPSFLMSEATDEVAVTFDNGDDWANEDDSAMQIYASGPKNPSVNYHKGPYRYAGLIQGNATTPPTSPETMDLPIPISAGQRVFVRAVVIRGDGRVSTSFRDFGDT